MTNDKIMRKTIYVLPILILLICCKKEEDQSKVFLKPYIANLISTDTLHPYDGRYYIHMDLKNNRTSEKRNFTFSETEQNMTAWYGPTESGLGMSIQGAIFYDTETSEELEISFYFNTYSDTAFYFCLANYRFADPWNNVAGANIHYFKPVNNSDPSTKYMYLGTNSPNCYFDLTYIGKKRLNGIFHTTMKECCGGTNTYDVCGDFSIPDIRFHLK
jgi:hypothetical protein